MTTPKKVKAKKRPTKQSSTKITNNKPTTKVGEIAGIEKDIRAIDLRPADYNPRKITDKQMAELKQSIKNGGFTQRVIVNSHEGRENVIVGGHQRVKAMLEMGVEMVPCIVVDYDIIKEKEMNVRYNKNVAGWDMEVLEKNFAATELMGWGFEDFELEGFGSLNSAETGDGGDNDGAGNGEEDNDSIYSKSIESPIYEVTGDKPAVSDLMDTEKTYELLEEIESADIPEGVREFLIAASQRHTVFDYKNIAEFYAHSDAEIQSLMERSALVIIDFEKAIEGGFVRLNEEVQKMYLAEYGGKTKDEE